MAEISRNSVRKAGEILINPDSSEDEIAKAHEKLSEWRGLHAEPMRAMNEKLSVAMKKYDGAIIAKRLKRTPSIVDKLRRGTASKLDRIQDIAGVRVILENLDSVRDFDEYAIHSRGLTKYADKFKDYIEHPKNSGYRSIHRIFRYENERKPESSGLLVELQIRTRIQHAWATAVETLGFIKKASFKTGEGEEAYKTFFELAGELLAIQQGTARHEKYASYSRKQIADSLKSIDSRLKITGTLEGLAVSTMELEKDFNSNAEYHLLQLDIAANRAAIQSFSADFEELVPAIYGLKEREAAKNPNLSVVLISVKTLNELKDAYPNYFLDTKLFLEAVRDML